MAENIRSLTHILLPKTQSVFDYQRRKLNMGDNPKLPNIPHRDQSSHGQKLLSDLQAIYKSNKNEHLPQTAIITFQGEAGKDFLYESLDNKPLKIKLLSLKETIENGEIIFTANVQFFDKTSFEKFSKILQDYIDNNLNKTSGSRKRTIECTSSISNASLENLFFDDSSLFPKDDEKVMWWELMLDGEISNNFINLATELKIQHDAGFKVSEDRSVVLVKANTAQLSELRKNIHT